MFLGHFPSPNILATHPQGSCIMMESKNSFKAQTILKTEFPGKTKGMREAKKDTEGK